MGTRRTPNQDIRHPPLAPHGLFITFEGIEGSGKTTHCHRLANLLKKQGYRVLVTREPGGTPLAEAIRRLLLTSPSSGSVKETITPHTEAMLIMASRSQHVTHVIVPALREGTIVLCDRFFDSTLAYQGYGRGMNLQDLQDLHRMTTNGMTPDLTLLFDLSVSRGLARRKSARVQNRIDRETRAFHERVRKGFLALAQQHPRRITTINSAGRMEHVSRMVDESVVSLLEGC